MSRANEQRTVDKGVVGKGDHREEIETKARELLEPTQPGRKAEYDGW